jgi:hypothetical protein
MSVTGTDRSQRHAGAGSAWLTSTTAPRFECGAHIRVVGAGLPVAPICSPVGPGGELVAAADLGAALGDEHGQAL